jgi:hypothetical protein
MCFLRRCREQRNDSLRPLRRGGLGVRPQQRMKLGTRAAKTQGSLVPDESRRVVDALDKQSGARQTPGELR